MELHVIERDKVCVYCSAEFGLPTNYRTRWTWEHIINDILIITRENIVRCCASCNSSKGNKLLSIWLESVDLAALTQLLVVENQNDLAILFLLQGGYKTEDFLHLHAILWHPLKVIKTNK